MQRALAAVGRFLFSLRRPTKSKTARLLAARGETARSIAIREATAADIPALAQLHVTTFNETHRLFGHGPTYAIREWQYKEKFAKKDARWSCFVACRPDGELVGFAIGEGEDEGPVAGRLNKLYLLRDYQRAGLGRRLVGHVVRRFVDQGMTSMHLFSEAANPSIRFFEALGGDRMISDKGEFHGGYRWNDLPKLAAICPIE